MLWVESTCTMNKKETEVKKNLSMEWFNFKTYLVSDLVIGLHKINTLVTGLNCQGDPETS